MKYNLLKIIIITSIVAIIAFMGWKEYTSFINQSDSKGIRASSTVKNSWTSPAGLYYGPDPSHRFASRIDHVMAHTKPDPSKLRHSLFIASDRQAVLQLIDEAWRARGPPRREGGVYGRDVYDIAMGRPVGRQGQTGLRIVVERESADIVTAYPVYPGGETK